jgi:hypothetical protein
MTGNVSLEVSTLPAIRTGKVKNTVVSRAAREKQFLYINVVSLTYQGKCTTRYTARTAQSYVIPLVGVSPRETKPVDAVPAWNTRHPQHDQILA